MQHQVRFASETKQRHVFTTMLLVVEEDCIPSAQVNKGSGDKISCSRFRKCILKPVLSKKRIAMSRASMQQKQLGNQNSKVLKTC